MGMVVLAGYGGTTKFGDVLAAVQNLQTLPELEPTEDQISAHDEPDNGPAYDYSFDFDPDLLPPSASMNGKEDHEIDPVDGGDLNSLVLFGGVTSPDPTAIIAIVASQIKLLDPKRADDYQS